MMIARSHTLVEEARKFADDLDAINDRSLINGAEKPDRIAKILAAHEAHCAELARVEAQQTENRARRDRPRQS